VGSNPTGCKQNFFFCFRSRVPATPAVPQHDIFCQRALLQFTTRFFWAVYGRNFLPLGGIAFGPFRVCCDTCHHSFWWRVIGTCWHFINKTACPSGLRRMTRNHLGLPAQVQILLLSITFCPPLAYGEEGLLAQAVPLAPCTDLK
jgi:hypothetical protein